MLVVSSPAVHRELLLLHRNRPEALPPQLLDQVGLLRPLRLACLTVLTCDTTHWTTCGTPFPTLCSIS